LKPKKIASPDQLKELYLQAKLNGDTKRMKMYGDILKRLNINLPK